MALLEIACFTPESAIVANDSGAGRIELCDDQSNGGVSPPLEWLRIVKARVTIPVFVMIRPRGGNFCYSDGEFVRMRDDLDLFKQNGADGFVLGLLQGNGEVDAVRTKQLVGRAHPLPCTFHRAFDESGDQLRALEQIVSTGCRAILTSGGASTAPQGIDALRAVVHSAGDRIDIIVGGGVRSKNLARLKASTGAKSFHSSALIDGAVSPDAIEIHRMRQQLLAERRATGSPPSDPASCTTTSTTAADLPDLMSMSAVSIGDRGRML